MYGILKNHKMLIGDNNREKLITTLKLMPQFNINDVVKCTVETAYNGEIWELGYAPSKPAPTNEEQEQNREVAYTVEVDPITAHISRLRDEEQTSEIIAEIETLIAERTEKVSEIKARFPYMEV